MNPVSILTQPFSSLLLIAASVVIMAVAMSRWKLRAIRPTAGTGALLLVCSALWMVTNAAEMASPNLNTALFWYTTGHVGIAPISVLWFAMALQFSGYSHLLTRRRLVLLSLIPVVSVIILSTNSAHGLFVASAHLEIQDSVAHLILEPGPFIVIHYVYAYVIVMWGTYLLTRKMFRTSEFRWQGSMVLVGVVLVVVANILDWSQLNPIPPIELTPFTLIIAVVLFIITLIRVRRADIIPIARSNVIQIMQDAVLVLDVENRILDMNPAAENIIGHRLTAILGKTIDDSLPEWAEQIDILSRMSTALNEIRLGERDHQRVFDVRRSELNDWRGKRNSRVIVLRDVTERARAEEVLRLSEEHFRALTENATDMVVIVDGDAVISYASPSIERTFEFKVDALVGKNAVDFVHPDDVSAVMMGLAASVRNPGRIAPLITRFRHIDGSWRKLECIANNLLDHPAVSGIVVNARDVTDREAIEERLRLSEEYFRVLTENSTDVTIITNSDGTVQYVSPSLMRIFGRSRDEVIGKSTLDFIHPDDVNPLRTSMADSMRGSKISGAITARFHDKNGNWHILECLASNMLDHPAIQGIVVNARDVTEREAIAEILRQSEERYRLHFAHVNDVIYSFDSNLQIISVSPSVERILGYKPEELLGRSLSNLDDLTFLAPKDFEKAARETIRVLSGERIEDTVYEFIAKDGTPITAEISGSPVYHEGQIIATVNVARDISERVRTEEHLRSSLQEKEVLLKEVHHRVKNNLQIIASLLNLQSNAIDNPFVLAQFQDSQNRIRSMALIHERLYRSTDIAYVDFREYLRDLTGHLLQSYRAKTGGVALKVEVDDIHLDIDTAIPCGLLVNEMVSNALKHAFPDGRSGAIGVEMMRSVDGNYRLTVWDNGVGFPADVDYRQTTSLGLQLVNSLTRQMAGTVEICNSPGTRFTVCFPKTISHPSTQVKDSQ